MHMNSQVDAEAITMKRFATSGLTAINFWGKAGLLSDLRKQPGTDFLLS